MGRLKNFLGRFLPQSARSAAERYNALMQGMKQLETGLEHQNRQLAHEAQRAQEAEARLTQLMLQLKAELEVSQEGCRRWSEDYLVNLFGNFRQWVEGFTQETVEGFRAWDEGHINGALEASRRWEEGHINGALAANRRWEEGHINDALAANRRWEEGHINGALAANRQWEEGHINDALAANRQWEEGHINDALAANRRWEEGHINDALAANRQWEEGLLHDRFGAEHDWTDKALEVLREQSRDIEKRLAFLNALMEKVHRDEIEAYVRAVRAKLPIMDISPRSGAAYARIGRRYDGGYVMLDDFKEGQIAYSFGICDDVSWDRDMADRGVEVYQYDHTIEAPPEENERFHFYRTGLCGKWHAERPELKTLPMLLKENGHEAQTHMVLKMDIEGWEWETLDAVSEDVLKQFSQIVLELHGLNDMENLKRILGCLEKLNATHQLVHVHANNYGDCIVSGEDVLPDLLEVTCLNRGEYSFVPSERAFPTALDDPNDPLKDEIPLGRWTAEA